MKTATIEKGGMPRYFEVLVSGTFRKTVAVMAATGADARRRAESLWANDKISIGLENCDSARCEVIGEEGL